MKLEKHKLQTIESFFRDIEVTKRRLKFREWELLNPHQEQDANTGGGRSNKISDTTFNKASVLSEDVEYQQLKLLIKTIEHIYETSDDDQKKIIAMRYWDKESCYEWQDIADHLYMSVSRVLRKRNAIIDRAAKALAIF